MPIFSSPTHDGQTVRRGRFRVLPIVLFGLFAAFYYFTHQEVNPYTGRKQLIDMSPQQEAALGLAAFREVLAESQVVTSGEGPQLVRSVGERIARVANVEGYDWEFVLLNSQDANAFCLPGGKVAVHAGLLPIAQSADGLAVVMGHEIAHALSHHGAERMAQQKLAQFGQMAVNVATGDMDQGQRRAVLGAFGLGAQYGVLLPFSRKHESEADYIGLMLMARACFNPEEAIEFWARMGEATARQGRPPGFASTHPTDATRITQLRGWMAEANAEKAKYCK